jgi:FAD/FMN-containing dehydrogenase
MSMTLGATRYRLKGTTAIVTILVAVAGLFAGLKVAALSADPAGDKACTPVLQGSSAGSRELATAANVATLENLVWSQRGGTINDASCVDSTDIYGIVEVHSVEDIARTLAFARAKGLKVTAAGARHSMGGQAFDRGGIVLDMRRFNRMALDAETRTVTVGSGTTWHDLQDFLHPRFAVRAMQSTDIFTVGGSISVNAHGMDHQAGAMAKSIKAMRVMLADGTVEEVSREKNGELFNLIVGGYGLFGIILEADLDIADNVVYRTGRRVFDYREFPKIFAEEIEPNHALGLTYLHLSTAPSSYLREALLYTYTQVDGAGADIKPLGEVGATRLRRLMINLSKQSGTLMELKWLAEKYVEPRFESCTVSRTQSLGAGEACLVTRNNPMHDSVAYLRNNLKNDTDILHEYFIPRDQFVPFIDGMRQVLLDNETNLLNASVRIVDKEDNFLTYSPQKAFSIVLYINQTADEEGNRRMRKVTGELIELTLAHGGRFFLPYQLYYTPDQLRRSYPQIADFFAAKRKYDPQETLTNTFYRTYAEAILPK